MSRVLLLVLAFMATLAAGEPARYAPADGGFSYVPPAGWTMKEMPGMKFKSSFGPADDGIAPNLQVADAHSPHDFVFVADSYLQAMSNAVEEYQLVERAEFVTASGLKGLRVIVTAKQGKLRLRQIIYVFPGTGEQIFINTGTASAKVGKGWDHVFDTAMTTFAITK